MIDTRIIKSNSDDEFEEFIGLCLELEYEIKYMDLKLPVDGAELLWVALLSKNTD